MDIHDARLDVKGGGGEGKTEIAKRGTHTNLQDETAAVQVAAAADDQDGQSRDEKNTGAPRTGTSMKSNASL